MTISGTRTDIAGGGGGIELEDIPADGAAGTASLRTLGQGSVQALNKTTADTIYAALAQVEALQAQVDAIEPAATGAYTIADDRHVTTRGFQTANGSLSDGTVTGGNYKSFHTLRAPIGVAKILFTNFGKQAGPNAITVSAHVEKSDTHRIQVRFDGGATSVVIPAGGMAYGYAPVFQAAGSTIFVRTFVEPRGTDGNLIASGKWPRMSAPPYWIGGNNGERASESVGETSLTASGGPSGTTGLMFYPAKISSVGAITPITSIGITGDSISVGSSDRPDSGLFARAINEVYPSVYVGQIGDGVSSFRFIDNATNRWRLLSDCTHIWSDYGVNDLAATGSNLSAASVKTHLIALWKQLAASGAKVRQTTVTPHASSTDDWTTLTNQTPDANNAAMQDVNAWLRDGAPITSGGAAAVTGSSAGGTVRGGQTGHPLYADITDVNDKGIDDTGAVLEEGTTGKWKLAFPPADAFHPTGSGHAAMAAVLNLNWLAQ